MKSLIPNSTNDDSATAAVDLRLAGSDPFIEPLAGYAPMLFKLKYLSGSGILNDRAGLATNTYRAVKYDPQAVADHAAWPVNQWDLVARRGWLLAEADDLAAQLRDDPNWYDAKLAGWCMWGLKAWGIGWCSGARPKLPNPAAGRATREDLELAMCELARRLEKVTITCGDWRRILAPRLLTANAGVFLDPPYARARLVDGSPSRDTDTARDCREWAIEHGHGIKIALCSYEGEPPMPAGWDLHRCEPQGGNGGGSGKSGGRRRCIWFSPRAAHPQMLLPFD